MRNQFDENIFRENDFTKNEKKTLQISYNKNSKIFFTFLSRLWCQLY